jgi:hypothetical protein
MTVDSMQRVDGNDAENGVDSRRAGLRRRNIV